MKAVAFSNNDIAIVAWTFGGRLLEIANRAPNDATPGPAPAPGRKRPKRQKTAIQ